MISIPENKGPQQQQIFRSPTCAHYGMTRSYQILHGDQTACKLNDGNIFTGSTRAPAKTF